MWAGSTVVRSHGLRIGVRVNRLPVLDHVRPVLPPGARSSASALVDRLYSLRMAEKPERRGVRHFNLLYRDSQLLSRSEEPAEVVEALEHDLDFFVASAARRRTFVHAGVVALNGCAVVLPGPSLSGKTRLVKAFVEAGATYYSDDYAVLDREGRVHPYARPLSIREGPRQRVRYEVAELGGRSGTQPLPVGLVVFGRYVTSVRRWRPKVLSPGEAMIGLLENAVNGRTQPELALAALRQVVLGAPALKGSRGEASNVVARVVATMQSA